MRVSTSQMFARGLAALQSQQAGLSRTQQQVASGQRILQPADDPTGAKRVIDLERGIALSKQYEDNGNLARSRLEREESALVGVRDVLDKVRELALQGNNATISAPDRAAIARELQVQLEQLVAVANTQDGNGEYLFSGFATRTQPFSLAPAGGASYAGDQGSRRVQIGPNRDIAVGDPGNAIFQNIRTGNGTFVTGYDAPTPAAGSSTRAASSTSARGTAVPTACAWRPTAARAAHSPSPTAAHPTRSATRSPSTARRSTR